MTWPQKLVQGHCTFFTQRYFMGKFESDKTKGGEIKFWTSEE